MRRTAATAVTSARAELGEGCLWDEVTQTLLWVDVFAGHLRQATYESGRLTTRATLQVPGPLTALAPLRDRTKGWVVAAGEGIGHLTTEGELTMLTTPESGKENRVRMNDAACDPFGRFWVGSMAYDASPYQGSLYRYSDGRCTRMLENLTIANGIGWSPDATRMYHTDSGTGVVSVFDFDADSGEIANRRSLVALPPTDGVPDGMCVDADGCLWVALWGGGEVRRYSPEGAQLAAVSVPATQPSCCTLGGPDGRTLFITSARAGISAEKLADEPDAGLVFAVEVGTPGQPVAPYGGDIAIQEAPRGEDGLAEGGAYGSHDVQS